MLTNELVSSLFTDKYPTYLSSIRHIMQKNALKIIVSSIEYVISIIKKSSRVHSSV